MPLSLTLLLLSILPIYQGIASAQTVIRDTKPLPRDGLITDAILTGLTGTTYHSIQYEPVCGTLGTASTDLYTDNWDIAARCSTAMEAYVRIPESFAVFDRAGVRVEGGVVIGSPLCICLSLSDARDAAKADLCLYINEEGRTEEYWGGGPPFPTDDYLASTFHPNSNKALPQCSAVNLAELSASRSAAASTASETGKTSAGGENHSASSLVTVLSTATNSRGEGTATFTLIVPTSVNVTAPAEGKELSRSDKIAIGLGLGVGIPSIVIALWGVLAMVKKRNRAGAAARARREEASIGLRDSPRMDTDFSNSYGYRKY